MAKLKLGTIPGVYVQEEVNPELAITEQRLKTAGLIGHAKPTVNVANVAVVRSDKSTSDVIPGYTSGLDVDPESENCIVISDYVNAKGSNLPQYRLGVDYTAAIGTDGITITWLDAESGESDADIVHPVEGGSYYVSFTADRGEDSFQPLLWNDIDSIEAFYGPAYYKDATSGEYVINEITTAARLMFSNGAQTVLIRALKSSDDVPETEIVTALGELALSELQTVICIPQSLGVHNALKKEVVVDSATENGKERITWISGAYAGTQLSDLPADIAAYAKSIKEQRVVLIAPSKVTLLLEDEDGEPQEVLASSIYAAAALVGMTTDNNRTVAEPLTRKNPVGIYGLADSMDMPVNYVRSEVEMLSAAGVTVLVTRNNAVSVNQAVTTDNSNQNNREVSVVLIKDEVMKDLRSSLDSKYIGHFYNRNTTPTEIKGTIMLRLDEMIGTLVQDYDQSDIIVKPDQYDTTRVNVKLGFSVLRPLNYIYITFMVTV